MWTYVLMLHTKDLAEKRCKDWHVVSPQDLQIGQWENGAHGVLNLHVLPKVFRRAFENFTKGLGRQNQR